MDATSAGGNGFDAALKALEDLETSVAQPREEAAPGAAVAPSIGPISLIDAEPEGEAVPIVSTPLVELEMAAVDVARDPPPEPELPVASSAAAVSVAPVSPPASGKLGKIALGVACFSSLLSAAGLIVAERTIMSAQLVVATARERAEQLEQANKLIRDLEIIRDKQIELLQRQQAQLASTPVTSEELQRKMDSLQLGLMARDPMNDVVSAIRAGQADNNARFSEFGMKIDRLETAMGQ